MQVSLKSLISLLSVVKEYLTFDGTLFLLISLQQENTTLKSNNIPVKLSVYNLQPGSSVSGGYWEGRHVVYVDESVQGRVYQRPAF